MVLAAALALSGCGGLEGAVDDWADDACECKDKDCAKEMSEKFDELENKYRDDIKEVRKSNDKEAFEKIDKAYRKGAECLKKFDVHAG